MTRSGGYNEYKVRPVAARREPEGWTRLTVGMAGCAARGWNRKDAFRHTLAHVLLISPRFVCLIAMLVRSAWRVRHFLARIPC
jgi:hypothetical protein